MFQPAAVNVLRTVLICLSLLSATTCSAMPSSLSELPTTMSGALNNALAYFTAEAPSDEDLYKKAMANKDEFNKTIDHLTSTLALQNYSILSLDVDALLKGKLKNQTFRWLKQNMNLRMDRFCLFTYIRTNAMLTRATYPLENLDTTLSFMIAMLILVASDIICCRAVGNDDSIFDNFLLFRDTFKYWFFKYLVEEGIEFKEALDGALVWLDAREKDEANLKREELTARHYYAWVRHVSQGTDQYFHVKAVPNVSFGDTTQEELCGCITTQTSVDKWRKGSTAELCAYLRSNAIKSWVDFFRIDLAVANEKTISLLKSLVPNTSPTTTLEKTKKMKVVSADAKDAKEATAASSGSTSIGTSSSFSASSSSSAQSINATAATSVSVVATTVTPNVLSQPKLGGSKPARLPIKSSLNKTGTGSASSSPRTDADTKDPRS